jgi:hypothetical protein
MAKKKNEGNQLEDIKNKLLEKLAKKTDKEYKTINQLENVFNPSDYIDYGNVMINLITGGDWKKGMPNNISLMFVGEKDSGKSLMSLLAMKDLANKGYLVFYYETEGAISLDKMKEFGINTEFIIPVDDFDHLIDLKFSVLEKLNNLDISDKAAFIYDSVAMVLDSEKFTKNAKADETKTMGKDAQERNDFFKATIKKACRLHKAQIFINRTYSAFDVANPKYTSDDKKQIVAGGSAGQFGVSSILSMEKTIIYNKYDFQDQEGTEVKNKTMKYPIGSKFTISSSRKYRLVKPGLSVYFVIQDDKGLLRYSGLTPFAEMWNYLEKVRGGWKLSNSEKTFKNLVDVPDDIWLDLLDNHKFGDKLNEFFSLPKVDGGSNFDFNNSNSNEEIDEDNSNE